MADIFISFANEDRPKTQALGSRAWNDGRCSRMPGLRNRNHLVEICI
jgi:hypothetical protein